MMTWDELKWYKADRDYSFSLVKALVKTKNGSYQVRDHVTTGQWYIPLPVLERLPKQDG